MTNESVQPQLNANEVITQWRRTVESEAFYTRSLEDPFAVTFADTAKRQALAAESAHSMSGVRALEAVEFGTDSVYRGFGVEGAEHTTTMTGKTFKKIDEILTNTPELKSDKRLALQARQLDLISVLAVSKYQEGKETRDVDSERSAWALLGAISRDVIRQGVKILAESHPNIDKGDIKERRELSGKLFEVLYTSFLRLEAYDAEESDKRVIVGATAFEDEAATYFQPKSHNYDILVMDEHGQTQELIQCKTDQTSDQYERPIQKVSGRSFERFIKEPTKYLDALTRLASNSPEFTEEQMQDDRQLLEGLFDESNRIGPRQHGAFVLHEALSSN